MTSPQALTADYIIEAINATAGDLRNETLREAAGVYTPEAALLYEILHNLGLAHRDRGRPGCPRALCVPVAKATARIRAMRVTSFERPPISTRADYTIVYDPHQILDIGTPVSRNYLRDYITAGCADADGLEVTDRRDRRWRAYHGKLYQLQCDAETGTYEMLVE